MEIEIAKMERMSQTGSSLLRLIQNSHTPVLDLLVRESIQNSLDAAANDHTPVKFDISINRYRNENVAKHFKGIDQKLLERFSTVESGIVLRDKNTVGLTGPIHQDDVENNQFGNLLKLIYEISMPQEKKEAGGSWGLGKTVYFRIGIGLVIYYSRIKLEDGTYQSRLAACLVEDESREDSLIPAQGNNKRGIAWWGELHDEDSTKPISNETFIKRFLADFNVQPFADDETGTTIIIPYVDSDKLLIKPEQDEEGQETGQVPWWYSSMEKYLNVAIQRWYAPRIDNPNYKYGNYLIPSIDNTDITTKTMEPMFRIVRGLYNYSESNEKDHFIQNDHLKVENVVVHRDLESNIAGRIAFIKVNHEELQMVPPYNKWSPYEYIDEHSYSTSESNVAIICYVRKPGMIINYEVDSKWTQGIETTNDDQYIIGIFIPKSNNIVKLPDISLDEYLRQGEKADHSSWEDTNHKEKRFTIVERMQKRTAQAIKDVFNKEEEKVKGTRSGALSASLASSLLPPVGFGKSPAQKVKKGSETSTKSSPKGSFNIVGSRKSGDNLIVTVEVSPKKDQSYAMIEALIESEGNRKIRGDNWERDIRTEFPIEIDSARILSQHDMAVNFLETNEFSIKNQMFIKLVKERESFVIDLSLKIKDQFIQPNLAFEFRNEVTTHE